MLFVSLLSGLLASSLVVAQNMTIQVQVGSTSSAPGGIYQFIPNNINATEGSVINFQFTGVPGNHSITQSTAANPCTPLSGGFDSGWVLILSEVSTTPEWNLTITNASTPIWFFCKQLLPSPHCVSGMVGAINAPTSGNNTFEAFQNNAKAFKGSVGQDIGALTGPGGSASADPGPIPSGATAFGAPNPSATAPSSGSGSAASGASGSSPSATTTSSSASAIALNPFIVLLTVALRLILV